MQACSQVHKQRGTFAVSGDAEAHTPALLHALAVGVQVHHQKR